MFLNYLKLSLRLLVRNPFFHLINVVGLSIGFASFFSLWQYSTSELKSDSYHVDAERIARICVNWRWTDDGGQTWGKLMLGGTPGTWLPKMAEDFPEVESWVRIINQPNFLPDKVGHGNKVIITIDEQKGQPRIFKEEKVAYADPNLFTFFTIPLIYGQSEMVLKEVNDVVLSQSIAEKYFGKRNPTGELLRLNDSTILKVSGVYENLPHQSHLFFEMVISGVALQNRWNADDFLIAGSYVKLRSNNFQHFEAGINDRTDELAAAWMRLFPNAKLDLFVQPVADVLFSENFLWDTFHSRSRPFLNTLAFIALSVLVMAWVNYVNLSVTRTTRRFKEIATRKVSGAGLIDMIIQFVTESMMTNLLAIALAFTIIQMVRNPVAFLFDIQICRFSSLDPHSMFILLSIIVSGILLSGLYPAFISMAHLPRSLFGARPTTSTRRLVPALLSVSQLAAAVVFILLSFTVSLQISHVLNMNTGINKHNVVVIDAPVIKPVNYPQVLHSIKDQIAVNSNASSITCSRSDITEFMGTEGVTVRRIGSDLNLGMDANTVDEDFIPFFGIKLLTGRNFFKDSPKNEIIISQVAASRLGFSSPQEALGAKISLDLQDAEVIGVFQDLRLASFLNMNKSSTEANDQGRGIVLMNKNQLFEGGVKYLEKISIRIFPQNLEPALTSIQALFEQEFPGNAFTWYFLDEHAQEVYVHEKTARNQIVLFTTLALFIACLGLLGMMANLVIEKTKEIGIRKVMGAQLPQIAAILLNTTWKQLIIATAIGIPLSYYLIQLYLDKFSERIVLQWWHFTLPVLILVMIMFSTIASVLWKAARNNPVEALKYE